MYRRIWTATAFLALGCGSVSLKQRVANSAASHWHCSAENIKVEQVDGDTYRATGCDHEADYSCESAASASDKECERVSGM
jgi:hypothetical protein